MAFNICTDGESDDDADVTSCGDGADVPDVIDPFGKVFENIPSETHMLEPVDNCEHCNAKKFQFEPPGFCCRSGKIHLSSPDTPLELMRLWSSSDADARHFRANIRFFNGHFSFTSLYCHLDHMTTNMRNGGRGFIHSVHMVRYTIMLDHLVRKKAQNLDTLNYTSMMMILLLSIDTVGVAEIAWKRTRRL